MGWRLPALLVATVACGAAATPAAAAPLPLPGAPGATVQPYGANDAGGFRNVLPPGENGLANALTLAQNQATGAMPPHFADQQPLYDNLIYASPRLTDAQIPSYFKDATFGVPAGGVASSESPTAGLTIVRDGQYGVPHVYGDTRAAVMFGAGYAAAEDRLFLMDVLRHTGRATLSSFVGGSAGNRAMDRTQWSLAPYTEADLQSQIDNGVRLYGAAGQQIVDDVTSYVNGINAYIDAATVNPQLLPVEYAAVGKTPQHWMPTDVVATASLIGGIFGKGGGRELDSAVALEAFQRRFGAAAGRRVWADFRSKNDPEAPTTLSRSFPYETASPFSRSGLALPDPGSISPAAIGPALSRSSRAASITPARVPVPDDSSIGGQLLRLLSAKHGAASNWELVAARHSATGHPIAVMGPQVGYYVPQILMEEDLHGPGIDARGAAFPGVNLYVELGHGRDYAWSATTATADNVDTFAEVLCQDDYHYLYRGQCLPMEQLQRTNAWTPTATDSTPPGSETLTVYRTVHGIVYSRGTVGGRKVAFASARTTYFHEADSALGFSQLNDPNFVTSPQRFQQAAANINFGFNWAYVDASKIAYYESGWYPQRAAGSSPDFPVLGTGQFDWKGYDPTLHTLDALPFGAHPNATDPDYLVSWNNKQAPKWSAADDQWGYGPLFRSQMIAGRVKQGIAGKRRMKIAQLVQAMEEPATTDLRIARLWPLLKQVIGSQRDPRVRGAIAALDTWYAHGGHRRDLARKGSYPDTRAIEIMDAWWPKLAQGEFGPALGASATAALESMLSFGNPDPGATATPPDFTEGWYGYVSKDLRDLLAKRAPSRRRRRRPHARRKPTFTASVGARAVYSAAPAVSADRRRRARRPRVKGAYSRIYCGGGSLRACRAMLVTSLLQALAESPQQIYGNGPCSGDPQPSCYDKNRSVAASAITLPPAPFQNRPTFQQAVTLTRHLPR